jgi:putative pyruvate formate lyase activating enzyme
MKNSFFPHYNSLLNGNDVAYYLMCKSIPVIFSPNATLDELWSIHNEIGKNFKESLQNQEINRERIIFSSYMDLKVEISRRMLNECEFCENKCRVNRSIGELGYCGISEVSQVSSAFLHHGEESPLVPSGTIFFSGCTFECVFCQNYDISTIGKQIPIHRGGTSVDGKQLALLADVLGKQGAKNVNYVGGDPSSNVHTIIESLNYQSNNICQLWNSNFYNTLKTLDLLIDLMDFWLPDLKYGNNECGAKYSKVSNYWDVLTRNLKYIHDWGSKDIIIRHLVMPGHLECCTEPILNWIAKELPDTAVNIMGQYHPDNKVDSKNYSEINRRVTHSEMIKAYTLAERLGIPYKIIS